MPVFWKSSNPASSGTHCTLAPTASATCCAHGITSLPGVREGEPGMHERDVYQSMTCTPCTGKENRTVTPEAPESDV